MKRSIIILLMLAISVSIFGQQPSLPKTYYLHKAKGQNTLGWVLLSSGFAAATTGLIVGTSHVDDYFVDVFDFDGVQEKHPSGAAWMITGGVLMVSSIPFFVAASQNKRKAATAFFKMETQTLVRQGSFIKTSYPAIAFKINL